MQDDHDRPTRGLSRRDFLRTGAVVGAGLMVVAHTTAASADPDPTGGQLRVGGLTVGERHDPLGIQASRPRLGWKLTAGGTNRQQIAYEIRVATDASRLRRGIPDLWNSGRVSSAETSQIAYGGAPLVSRTRAFWQVRTWDEGNRRSEWSPVGSWETGLCTPGEWSAAWIGNPAWDALQAPVPAVTIMLPIQQARYVRLDVTRLGLPLKEGWPDPVSRLQLAEVQIIDSRNPEVDLAKGAAVTASEMYAAPGTWEPEYLTDGKVTGDTPPIGYTSLERHGQDISSAPIWVQLDLGAAQSFDRIRLYPRTDTRTADGQVPNFPVDFTVRTASSPDGAFTVAATITDQKPPVPADVPAGLPLFARQFVVAKHVARARLYITGLGVYDATLNGLPTSRAVLEPGNTTYAGHLDYATVDVTDLLRRGENTLGVSLGTGIYDTKSYSTRYAKFNGREGAPKLLAQLELAYSDDTRETIATDTSWRTALGPTTFSNWYGGEDYDARRLTAGWDAPGSDISAWQPASAAEPPAPKSALTARSGPAVETVNTILPKAITEPKPAVYVFDLGTNVAGWQQLRVQASAGTKITMRPAELLQADGTIDYGTTGNPIYDEYTTDGQGVETWHPQFIYHGFRYIQVEGLPSAPKPDTISALVLRAANVSAGSFVCSNEIINGVHRIIDRAVQSNMYSVLTDCPTREKLGWLEEAHLVFDTVARNYDVAAYGHDLVQAMADAQLPDGLVPDIAPEYTVFGGGFRDDPNWGNSMVLVPWNLYLTYGDRDVLDTYYPNMQRYVEYLGSRATGDLLDYGLGDWATINASTPTGVTATYGYFQAADALRRIAGVLGQSADMSRYARLAEAIGRAFQTKYFDAARHTYATGSQTSDALALNMGIVPADEQRHVIDHLVANLQANRYHLNLGEIGLPALFDVLSVAGRHDVVYKIATQTSAPSYGAMLSRGATSLTEFWDGGGSQNHFMLGAIDKWFTSGLAGITQGRDSVGYRELLIEPAVVGDLTNVAGRYMTPHGEVRSEWRRSGQSVSLDVAVPVGCVATIRLPGRPDQKVGSGTYQFQASINA